VFDSTIPYDLRFFQSLDRFVQYEPWLERDKAMIDQLKSIGIEKGKPFRPDPKTQMILNGAAREANAWLAARYDDLFHPPYFETSRWAVPATPDLIEAFGTHFAKPDSYPIDSRGRAYSMGFFSAKHLGAGQFYLMTIKDKDGKDFDGGSSYRLTVPANAPVKQYWSATVYDRATHALIRDQKCQAALHRTLAFKRTPTVPLTFTSDSRRWRAGNRTGFPRAPTGSLKSSTVSTAQRNRFSTKRGSCLISRRFRPSD